MKNPFRRTRRVELPPVELPPVDPSGLEEAKTSLVEARAREIDVALSVDRTQRIIQVDNFGPKMARALREALR